MNMKRTAHNYNKRRQLTFTGRRVYVDKPTLTPIYLLLATVLTSLFIQFWFTTTPATVSAYSEAPEPTPTIEPTIAPEPTTAPKPVKVVKKAPVDIEQIIREEWGESAEIGLKIAFCESSYRPDASNKTSSARGLFQIINATWRENRKRMGLDTNPELRFDARENAKTAYFIYQHRGTQPWDASIKCHGGE